MWLAEGAIGKLRPNQVKTLSDEEWVVFPGGDHYAPERVEFFGGHYCVRFPKPTHSNPSRVWWFWKEQIKVGISPPLAVPYYSQRDNRGEWWRECNSSSCAMVASFLGNRIGDDDYVRVVNRFGDTTDHSAQTQALRSLGIQSTFRTDLDYREVVWELTCGRPVVLGVLHRGTLERPDGGHMIVAIGTYENGLVCHDPWGKGFAYTDTDGRSVRYPKSSLDRRWLVDGERSGWGRVFQGGA